MTSDKMKKQTKKELLALLLQEEGIETHQVQTIRRREKDGPLPLSFSQQRLWFLNQLNPRNPLHNQLFSYRLIGKLHFEILKDTFATIIKRHEILRTTFQLKTEKPVQVIAPPQPLLLPLIDLQGVPSSIRESVLLEETKRAARYHFDLAEGPLIQFLIFGLGPQEHVILLILHHIVSDGWSTGVLIREITTLYDAYLMNKPNPLPDLPIQYADFAIWQREWLDDKTLESLLTYWRQNLDGDPSRLVLPTDRPRPLKPSFDGALHIFELPKSLMDSLTTLCQEESATLFMLLLAAFNTLIYHYTKQEDIVVGSPIANRRYAETQSLIGFFVNTLILRSDLSGNPTFRELLQRTRQITLNAYDHQDLPFEKLVESLNPDRNLSFPPLFQVMFLYNTLNPGLNAQDLTLIPMHIDFGVSEFDMTVSIVETHDLTRGFVEYSTELFNPSTIESMMECYIALLRECAINPDRHISSIPLMSNSEKLKIISFANRQKANVVASNKLFHQLFEEQVQQKPDAVAVVFEEEQITYRQLNNRANQLAHMLQEIGVGPEKVVALCVERSIEAIIGILGILKAGGAYLPIDHQLPQSRIVFMIEDAQANVIVTQEKWLDILPDAATNTVICLDRDGPKIADYLTIDPVAQVTPANLAYIIFTSGSTGKPKGVLIEHQSPIVLLEALENVVYKDSKGPLRASLNAPLFFDVSVQQLVLLARGHSLIIVSEETRVDGKLFLEWKETNSLDVIDCTPSQLRLLVAGNLHEASQAVFLVAGEAIDQGLWDALLEIPELTFFNVYGPTECTVYASACRISPVYPTPSIGHILPGYEGYILDRHLRLAPIGIPGELYIGGLAVARHYLNRPQLTADKFIPSPFGSGRLYKTGDIVRYTLDGRLEYLERIDNQVKLRGFRIELGEIEFALKNHEAIQEAFVNLHQSSPTKKQLVAYLLPKEKGQEPSFSELMLYLKQQLPDYMVPTSFITLASIPLTSNGKLDRKAFPPLPATRQILENKYVAPRTIEEKELAIIWGQFLNVDRVGMCDNFFALGGHSLLAAQLIVAVNEYFQVDLSIRDLFVAPTIAVLARRISERKLSETNLNELSLLSIIPHRPHKETAILSYAQQRLWFLSQLFPNSSVYNLRFAVRLAGHLNISVLIKSICLMVQRHESFRTSFMTTPSGIPSQIISPEYNVKLPIIDMSHLSKAQKEVELQKIAEAEGARPFALTNQPLWRLALISLQEGEYVLLAVMHHIIFDGWSYGILISEISEYYRALLTNSPVVLPEIDTQYADFAEWQRKQLQGAKLAQLLAYWKKQLADSPLCQVPTDYPRPQVQTFNGAVYQFSFCQELSNSVKAFSIEHNVTLFMTLLSGFVALMRYYVAGDDILIGTDIANRNHPQLEKIIGFFVNQLVLRVRTNGNLTFLELLRTVHEVSTEAYIHQDLPFDKLVETLKPTRALTYSPFFLTKFVLQNASIGELEMPAVEAQPYDVPIRSAKYDILLDLEENASQIAGRLEYSTDLYKTATMTQFIEHYQTILKKVMNEPEIELEVLMEMLRKQDAERADEKRKAFKEMRQQKLRQLRKRSVGGENK